MRGCARKFICYRIAAEKFRAAERARGGAKLMDALSLFGLFAVTAMLACYALEDRSPAYVLAFAGACVLASIYGFAQGAWPFGVIEAIWAGVAVWRWRQRIRSA